MLPCFGPTHSAQPTSQGIAGPARSPGSPSPCWAVLCRLCHASGGGRCSVNHVHEHINWQQILRRQSLWRRQWQQSFWRQSLWRYGIWRQSLCGRTGQEGQCLAYALEFQQPMVFMSDRPLLYKCNVQVIQIPSASPPSACLNMCRHGKPSRSNMIRCAGP